MNNSKSNTHIHDLSLSLLSTCASINSIRDKLLVYALPAHLSEIMRSCKYFQLASKMPTSHIQGEQQYYKKRKQKSYNLEHYAQYI